MPRNKQNKINFMKIGQPAGDEDYLDFLSKMVKLPHNFWLPAFDVGGEIEKLSTSYGYAHYDVTRLFNKHNRDIQKWKVAEAYDLVVTRAKKFPNTLHFAVTSEANLEAMRYLQVFMQFDSPDFDNVIKLDDSMMHVVVFQGQFTIRCFDLKEPKQLVVQLQCFDPNGECPICLVKLLDVETEAPFTCRHQLCKACCKQVLRACPLCRCSKISTKARSTNRPL